ncbi:MAG: metallophosphoesterase [Pirellulaceae bacterium]|nr:metallophosphoesterase [Pirellulaceae bacterium]
MSILRRQFIVSSACASIVAANREGVVALEPVRDASEKAEPFSFALLGDLHYDKLEHHDYGWLEKNHVGDLTQIKNYSRITSEIMPSLFDSVRKSVADSRSDFVLQVGDFVQGLCGNEKLAIVQNNEALAFIESKSLGVPFLFTKGNHDVTGDGATDAFMEVFLPYLSKQSTSFQGGGEQLKRASYAVQHRDALFCFYDAYDRESLEWLEATLAKRTSRHCFVVIHPPVVPYGARATWHIYANERDKATREKLLDLLGSQNAFVLGGHIHRFNTICRETTNGGRFVQFAISSVVNSASIKPATELEGLNEYNGDQIRVEPNFSPDTTDARRKVYEAEAPYVKAFAYADLPGHAVVQVDDASVVVTMYAGISRNVYRTIDLTKLLSS